MNFSRIRQHSTKGNEHLQYCAVSYSCQQNKQQRTKKFVQYCSIFLQLAMSDKGFANFAIFELLFKYLISVFLNSNSTLKPLIFNIAVTYSKLVQDSNTKKMFLMQAYVDIYLGSYSGLPYPQSCFNYKYFRVHHLENPLIYL